MTTKESKPENISSEEQYLSDGLFHAIVDSIRAYLKHSSLSSTERAWVLAIKMNQQENLRKDHSFAEAQAARELDALKAAVREYLFHAIQSNEPYKLNHEAIERTIHKLKALVAEPEDGK